MQDLNVRLMHKHFLKTNRNVNAVCEKNIDQT